MRSQRTRVVTSEYRRWDVKRAVRDLKNFISNLRYHPLDPSNDFSVKGKIKLSKPVPVDGLVIMQYESGLVLTGVNNEAYISGVEFYHGRSSKAAVGIVIKSRNRTGEFLMPVLSYVDALTLLLVTGVYGEVMKAVEKEQVSKADEDAVLFVNFVYDSLKEIARNPVYRELDARELFLGVYRNTMYGSYSVFEYGGWREFSFITPSRTETDEKFVGLSYIDGRVYLKIMNTSLFEEDTVGIDVIGKASYRVSSKTLQKLPIGRVAVDAYLEGKKLVKKYMELSKYVFLGVKAYAI